MRGVCSQRVMSPMSRSLRKRERSAVKNGKGSSLRGVASDLVDRSVKRRKVSESETCEDHVPLLKNGTLGNEIESLLVRSRNGFLKTNPYVSNDQQPTLDNSLTLTVRAPKIVKVTAQDSGDHPCYELQDAHANSIDKNKQVIEDLKFTSSRRRKRGRKPQRSKSLHGQEDLPSSQKEGLRLLEKDVPAVKDESCPSERVGLPLAEEIGLSSSVKATPPSSERERSCSMRRRQFPQIDAKGNIIKRSARRGRKHYEEFSIDQVDVIKVVGCRIKIWWPLDEQWYCGRVTSYDGEKHTITYDDGEVELLDLRVERFQLPAAPGEKFWQPDPNGPGYGASTPQAKSDLGNKKNEGNQIPPKVEKPTIVYTRRKVRSKQADEQSGSLKFPHSVPPSRDDSSDSDIDDPDDPYNLHVGYERAGRLLSSGNSQCYSRKPSNEAHATDVQYEAQKLVNEALFTNDQHFSEEEPDTQNIQITEEETDANQEGFGVGRSLECTGEDAKEALNDVSELCAEPSLVASNNDLCREEECFDETEEHTSDAVVVHKPHLRLDPACQSLSSFFPDSHLEVVIELNLGSHNLLQLEPILKEVYSRLIKHNRVLSNAGEVCRLFSTVTVDGSPHAKHAFVRMTISLRKEAKIRPNMLQVEKNGLMAIEECFLLSCLAQSNSSMLPITVSVSDPMKSLLSESWMNLNSSSGLHLHCNEACTFLVAQHIPIVLYMGALNASYNRQMRNSLVGPKASCGKPAMWKDCFVRGLKIVKRKRSKSLKRGISQLVDIIEKESERTGTPCMKRARIEDSLKAPCELQRQTQYFGSKKRSLKLRRCPKRGFWPSLAGSSHSDFVLWTDPNNSEVSSFSNGNENWNTGNVDMVTVPDFVDKVEEPVILLQEDEEQKSKFQKIKSQSQWLEDESSPMSHRTPDKHHRQKSSLACPKSTFCIGSSSNSYSMPKRHYPHIEAVSCSANLLMVNLDRGWRETGANVEIHYVGNNWMLKVSMNGETLFSSKPEQSVVSGSTNRYTHAMMWKGDKGWSLEFLDRREWFMFKDLHDECFRRNARRVPNIPTPGVREVSDCHMSSTFVRPCKYVHQVGGEVDLALEGPSVLYDLDSEDEEMLGKINAERAECISEDIAEKVIYELEKASYLRKHDSISSTLALEICNALASDDIIMVIHEHWLKRREQKGMALVRYFQPAPWEQYQKQLQAWEAIRHVDEHSQKPAAFAFCLQPKGFDVRSRTQKHRPQKKHWISPVSEVKLESSGDLFPLDNGMRMFPSGSSDITWGTDSNDFSGFDHLDGMDIMLQDEYPFFLGKGPMTSFPARSSRLKSFADSRHRHRGRRPVRKTKQSSDARRHKYSLYGRDQTDQGENDSCGSYGEPCLETDLEAIAAAKAAVAKKAAKVAAAKRARAQELYAIADAAMHKAVSAVIAADAIAALETAAALDDDALEEADPQCNEPPRAQSFCFPSSLGFSVWQPNLQALGNTGLLTVPGPGSALLMDADDPLLPITSYVESRLGTELVHRDVVPQKSMEASIFDLASGSQQQVF